MSRRVCSSSRGFTLVETALAIVIVATGMLAMVAANQAFIMQNDWGERAAQAARLGGEIRERSLTMPIFDPVTANATWGPEAGEASVADWDDMDDFDDLDASGWAGTGPIDATGAVIPGMSQWRQAVRVESVDPVDLGTVVSDGSSEAVRVSVDVFWRDDPSAASELVTTVTWVHVR
ncbi:MAG: prepilin-type N-terminal cleavage/methylation domain-containing protein [Phycisphaerales bacterium]|jgi:Tfp pilus assembly protein PilV|nr:prepilin-type N-terminal cleavage/methylation domain-containing protein [Phycisphaerales bacterium]